MSMKEGERSATYTINLPIQQFRVVIAYLMRVNNAYRVTHLYANGIYARDERHAIKLVSWIDSNVSGDAASHGPLRVSVKNISEFLEIAVSHRSKAIFFSFPQEHSSSAFITLWLRLVGGKRTMDTTSPLLTSKTLLQSWTWCIIFNIIKERKIYWKMYPSECGRARKYVTCKGKLERFSAFAVSGFAVCETCCHLEWCY